MDIYKGRTLGYIRDYLTSSYLGFQVMGYHVPFVQVSFVFGEHSVSVLPFDPQLISACWASTCKNKIQKNNKILIFVEKIERERRIHEINIV